MKKTGDTESDDKPRNEQQGTNQGKPRNAEKRTRRKEKSIMKTITKRVCMAGLAAAFALALSTPAFAATTLDANGEQGPFTSQDTPVTQSKTLVIDKELKAYNVDEATINAPTISYTYTIAPATVENGTTVTDNANKHVSNTAVTVPVKAGVGTPTIANSGVVAWSPSEALTASTNGTANKKDISIDFSNVVFTGAGVYRYVINEALTTSGDTYAMSGVTETNGNHARYVDVYVRPAAEGYTNGNTAAQWDIYGFTCFYNNTSITDANKATGAVKTTGFVAGTSNGTTEVTADSYYTFNVELSKTVVNDGYGANSVKFPFTVLFTNSAVTKNVDVMGSTTGTVAGWTDPAAAAPSSGDIKGIAEIQHGGKVKYIGIPNGTAVEVYETNIATGVTYEVTTALTTSGTTTTTDNMVSWGSKPATPVAQTTKAAYESTKATFATTANVDDDNAYKVAITNTLRTISPTGVIMRFAPYLAMLVAGVVIFAMSRRTKAENEE